MAILNITDDTFKEETKRGLVLVDFWAPWCGPCKMIAPVLEEIDEEMGNEVKIIKLNADDNPVTVAEYGVMSIPTLILFKDGEVINRMAGYQPKENLVNLISNQKS